MAGSNIKKMRIDSDTELTLPSDAGSNTQVLQTDGSGTLDWTDHTVEDLSDTTITSATTGDVLKYVAGTWVNELPIKTFSTQGNVDGYTPIVGDTLRVDADALDFSAKSLYGCRIITSGDHTVLFGEMQACLFEGYAATLKASTVTNCIFNCENAFTHIGPSSNITSCEINSYNIVLGSTAITANVAVANTKMHASNTFVCYGASSYKYTFTSSSVEANVSFHQSDYYCLVSTSSSVSGGYIYTTAGAAIRVAEQSTLYSSGHGSGTTRDLDIDDSSGSSLVDNATHSDALEWSIKNEVFRYNHEVNDLDDVTITGTPADNEVVAYDTSSSEFINQTAAEAGLGTASDVSTNASAIALNTTHRGVTSGNPHSVSASDVSLGNVTNESKATMFTAAALTGASTAVTQSASDDSTKIATTAYADAAAGGAGGGNLNTFANQTALDSYTPTDGDQIIIEFDGAVFVYAQALTGCTITTSGNYEVIFKNTLTYCTFIGYTATLTADAGPYPILANCLFRCKEAFNHNGYYSGFNQCNIYATWIRLGGYGTLDNELNVTLSECFLEGTNFSIGENLTTNEYYTFSICTVICHSSFVVGVNGPSNAERLKLWNLNEITIGSLTGTIWDRYGRSTITCRGTGSGTDYNWGLTSGSGEDVIKAHGTGVDNTIPWTLSSGYKLEYTEKVAYIGHGNSVTILNSTSTDLIIDTDTIDTHGAYDDSTGEYTVPLAGLYQVNTAFYMSVTDNWDYTEYIRLSIFVEGASVRESKVFPRSTTTANFINVGTEVSALLSCAKGDVITIQVRQTSDDDLTGGGSDMVWLDIHKV